MVALGVGELIGPLSYDQLDIVDELERLASVMIENLVYLQDVAFMIVDASLHQGLLEECMVDVVYQECQVVLQYSHQSEPTFLEDLVIFDPLLLFEDELGEELLLVLFEVFNLQKQIGDNLYRLHVGLTQLILMLMMLVLLLSRIGLFVLFMYRVPHGFIKTLVHAVPGINGFYLKLLLVQGPVGEDQFIAHVLDLHHVALSLKAVNRDVAHELIDLKVPPRYQVLILSPSQGVLNLFQFELV